MLCRRNVLAGDTRDVTSRLVTCVNVQREWTPYFPILREERRNMAHRIILKEGTSVDNVDKCLKVSNGWLPYTSASCINQNKLLFKHWID